MTRWSDVPLDDLTAAVAGSDLWNAPGIPDHGLAPLRVTDGPNGARGPSFTGVPSACFPCGTALGATWDPQLVRRVGVAIAQEARTKGAHVLLAPTVNLHRHPLAGRNFECYSEDPTLTAMLAIGFIKGVQSEGVGVTVKHFVANDSEFERMTISSEVDEAVLRELYLVPFEAAVSEAGAWGVMSAYNRLNGTYCSEHEWLLTTVLRDEWGFDGFVISDWFGTHSTAPAANAGLDLEMPGPPQWFGRALDRRRRGGRRRRATTVERMVERLKVLADRTGASDGVGGGEPGSVDDPAHRALIREVAAESFVLLKNDDALLPLDRGRDRLGRAHRHRGRHHAGSWAAAAPRSTRTRRSRRAPASPRPCPTTSRSRSPAARSPPNTLVDPRRHRARRPHHHGPVRQPRARRRRRRSAPRCAPPARCGSASSPTGSTRAASRPGSPARSASTSPATGRSASRPPRRPGCCSTARSSSTRGTTVSAGTSFFGFGSKEIRATRTLDAGTDHALVIEFSGGNGAVSGLELGAAPPTPDHRARRRGRGRGGGRRRDRGGRHRTDARLRGPGPPDDAPPRRAGRARRRGRGREPAHGRVRERGLAGGDGLGRRRARRSSSAGCPARSGATRSPTCCSATARRAAACPPPSRCASRTRPRTTRIPARRVASTTPTVCSWATAATTAPAPSRGSASGTASRTRRSSTATSPSTAAASSVDVTNTGARDGARGRAALRAPDRRARSRVPSGSCAASPRSRSRPAPPRPSRSSSTTAASPSGRRPGRSPTRRGRCTSAARRATSA